MKNSADCIIVGAGVAGLAAALTLQEAGLKPLVLESGSQVGGRMQTEKYNGFLLDRGFQVYLTAYPEGKRFLDATALNFRKFTPGALILLPGGKKKIFADPVRSPRYLFHALFSGVGDIGDQLNLFSLTLRLKNQRNRAIFEKEEMSTSRILKQYGFSESIIQQFFQPFFAGIFLENDLVTSRRMFDFVLKMFARGHGAVPEKGMQSIPAQMAAVLPEGTVHLNQEVIEISSGKVSTKDGKEYTATRIILAVDASSALLKGRLSDETSGNAVTCLYFSADSPPYKHPLIALNAVPERLVNNLAVMTNVSKLYSDSGKALISVSINGSGYDIEKIAADAKKELSAWFGDDTQKWQLLKGFDIPYALPDQQQVKYNFEEGVVPTLQDGIYICGDHTMQGSINGAMRSGRLVAEHLLRLIEQEER